MLAHDEPPTFQISGSERHLVKGPLVYGVSLWGFFGYDGGIREKGEGIVGQKFRLALISTSSGR